MERKFWIIVVITVLCLYENFAHWLIAGTIGELGFVEGFNRAFKRTTFTGYLMGASFRAIPYAVLATVLAIFMVGKVRPLTIKAFAWTWYFTVAVVIAWGYLAMYWPFYTGGNISSTGALVIIFAPIMAMLYAIATGLISIAVVHIYQYVSSRKD
jgi:uncharacterized integral membrane protein